jgi:acetoin utilization protein AcuB
MFQRRTCFLGDKRFLRHDTDEDHPECGTSFEKAPSSPASEIMSKDLEVITLANTIQDALVLIQKHKAGALPVVDKDGRLAGVISVRDLLNSFVRVRGAGQAETLLRVLAPDKTGEMKRLVDTITAEGLSTGSILVARRRDEGVRAFFPYILSISVGPLKKKLREAGFEILDPMQWYLDNRGAVAQEG